MKNSRRLLTLLIIIGTIFWLHSQGMGLMPKVVDTTKRVVTMWNLRSIREVILLSGILDDPVDVRSWPPEKFSEFLRDHLWTRAGRGKDPALDPWKSPYALEEFDDGLDWVVVSSGPNLTPDLCDFEGPGGDDICLLLELVAVSE